MDDRKRYTLDKERLERLNDMKPMAKKILGVTARVAFKMMKVVVKTAWALPGVVKRIADRGTAEHRSIVDKPDKKNSSSGARNIPVN